jgi:hypothetical protein
MEILDIGESKDDPVDDIKNTVFNVFQKFHKFNIYPKDEWFLDLSIDQLKKMYSETFDFYRLNLSNKQKIELVPPNGVVFDILPKNIHNMNRIEIQTLLLKKMDKIISSCKTDALQVLAAYIALGGLVIVSKEARESYPNIAFAFS